LGCCPRRPILPRFGGETNGSITAELPQGDRGGRLPRRDRGRWTGCRGGGDEAECRALHGRRPGLGRYGLLRPSRAQDAPLRQDGRRGPALRPLLRRRTRLLAHARQRDDGTPPQPLRVLQVGALAAPAGDHRRRGAQDRGLRHWPLRQVASRLGPQGEPRVPGRQRLRRVALGAQLLRQRPHPQPRGHGRPDEGRELDGHGGRRPRVHPQAREGAEAVSRGRVVRLAPRPTSGDRGVPQALRRPAREEAALLRRDHGDGRRLRQAPRRT